MKTIFAKLVAKEDLSTQEMTEVAERLFSGQLSDAQTTAFLLGLTEKGESFDEIASLIAVIRSYAKKVPGKFHDVMDNCGTGGDCSFSFNISTTTSFLLAAGGIKLAKHGNRSISSKSGSADVLENLGIKIDASPEVIKKALEEVGLAFLFAQSMHPVMRHVGPARQILGIPTIMNIIGPLNHPMDLDYQLMGLYREDLQETCAKLLHHLGRKRAIIITGPDNMDEAALYGVNHYTLLDYGKITKGQFSYADLGMKEIPLAAIKGGNAKENADILVSVLKNEPSPYRETTIVNAALGFFAAGKVATLQEGVNLARQVLASGKALDVLNKLKEVQV
ncbi:anthranilate phosphoribosyltransferase [Streptococcus sciuri]|uniref:Anthranilate phosphoribosyltransferase n=1 Tax=Streptococcus sciuri TaxID=2973939 RepID=A0ABT2F4Q7_9STRE|nr:anthranilate phosphoribosyltransferase [Streptococcus sciuri]MCS4487409.1 anthranilate phosphoribosyltransferase [Streptococcus sciuri]